MGKINCVEDLVAYDMARSLRKEISLLCKSFPKSESFRLNDQLLRSSRSIAANIAEGFGRHHHQENIQFCRQARGSLVETIEHLNCALDEGYMSQSDYQRIRAHVDGTWKVLNGYIAYLQKCANHGVLRRMTGSSSSTTDN